MTKSEELQTLSNFIGSLPEDSYLRPMLEVAYPEIERDIQSDFLPILNVRQIQEHQCAIREEAKLQGQKILSSAQEEAETILSDAQRRYDAVETWRNSALREMERAQYRLQNL